MSIKSIAAKYFAQYIVARTRKWTSNPVKTQNKVFKNLMTTAASTRIGLDHDFKTIKTHADFVRKVPVRDYEALRSYVDRAVAGEEDILWPGKPLYFAKTSGTTSGAKYIPITRESMPTHIQAARNAILHYAAESGKTDFVNRKMIFLQGSPVLQEKNGIKLGRLSGIVAHYVPQYLQKNRLPSWETNTIEDWETKVDAVVTETQSEDLGIISGIPPWVQMYFERLQARTGKKIGDLYPNFQLFIYGGVNYAPYKSKFEDLIGRPVDHVELYPASEGFFAYQDKQDGEGMLLLLDAGIFYEFIEAAHFYEENAQRLTIGEVRLGVNYVMIISTTAGLWAYNVGDTVQFTSLAPYRLQVTGRIKHFISAFGEHVISKEVERAMAEALHVHSARLNEFTVAPQINPSQGLPYHEWFIEFEQEPEDLTAFARTLDVELQKQNSYYKDLIDGKVLQTLKIERLPNNAFNDYMRKQGKLGGQNKLPRLSNDRKIADALPVVHS